MKTLRNSKTFFLFCCDLLATLGHCVFSKIEISEISEISEKYGYHDNAINDLLKLNILLYENNNYYINYTNKIVSFIKKSNDTYKLATLPDIIQSDIQLVKKSLINNYKNNIYTIMLVGSFSRNTYADHSDIDMLVVTNNKTKKYLPENNFSRRIQIICFSKNEFIGMLLNGDEIALWSLKFGIPLYNKNNLTKLYNVKNIEIGKTTLIKKRDLIERLSIKISDYKEIPLIMLVRYFEKYISQIARFLLLANDAIPRSSPELINQLNDYYPELVKIIKEFNNSSNLHNEDIYNYHIKIKIKFHKILRNL